jgi:ubiquinone/menaquinone biosynthesis C-methylase UbiE
MGVERVPLAVEPISGQHEVMEYDKYAGTYMLPEYKYFIRKILHQGIRSGRVLDLGTGSGRLAIELAKARNCSFEIIALDISENMLQIAQRKAREAGVENKIKFVQASASCLPFSNQSFDLVMSYASLHHWFQPISVFNEVQRIINSSGTLIIRDNRRIYGDKIWEAIIWGINRFMNKTRRENWRKVILSSYTIVETRDLLKESGLKNCRVSTDFVGFDVSICRSGSSIASRGKID